MVKRTPDDVLDDDDYNPFRPERIVVTPEVAARLNAICEEEPHWVFNGTPEVPEDDPEFLRRMAEKFGYKE